MYGTVTPAIFLVFCNPGAGGDDALAEWYMKVHGPDALENGSFRALHRYRAVGDYDARFLAIWEGDYRSRDEASAYITPRATNLRAQGRVTDDMHVVWATIEFTDLAAPAAPTPAAVRTLTLVEGGEPFDAQYRYGPVRLIESADAPAAVVAGWSGNGNAGMAPHGPYRPVFDRPGETPPPPPTFDGTWVSHWEPIGSLVCADGAIQYVARPPEMS
jgi:hypothetical protein